MSPYDLKEKKKISTTIPVLIHIIYSYQTLPISYQQYPIVPKGTNLYHKCLGVNTKFHIFQRRIIFSQFNTKISCIIKKYLFVMNKFSPNSTLLHQALLICIEIYITCTKLYLCVVISYNFHQL